MRPVHVPPGLAGRAGNRALPLARPRKVANKMALGAAAAAIALAGCGRLAMPAPGGGARPAAGLPAASSVAGGRYVRAVRISGLLVAPAGGGAAAHQGLTWRQAAALFEATSQILGSHAGAVLGYGLVTLSGRSLPPRVPRLARRGAWVGITWGGSASCPADSTPRPPGSPAAGRPVFTAVVIYGDRGNGALVYSSRGVGPCGGPPQGPSAALAREALSVPWRQLGPVRGGDVRVSYRAPACARMFSTSAAGDVHGGPFTLTVEVTVPFDRSACPGVAVRSTAIGLFPPFGAPGLSSPPPRVSLVHGRTGPVRVLQAGRVAGAPG